MKRTTRASAMPLFQSLCVLSRRYSPGDLDPPQASGTGVKLPIQITQTVASHLNLRFPVCAHHIIYVLLTLAEAKSSTDQLLWQVLLVLPLLNVECVSYGVLREQPYLTMGVSERKKRCFPEQGFIVVCRLEQIVVSKSMIARLQLRAGPGSWQACREISFLSEPR